MAVGDVDGSDAMRYDFSPVLVEAGRPPELSPLIDALERRSALGNQGCARVELAPCDFDRFVARSRLPLASFDALAAEPASSEDRFMCRESASYEEAVLAQEYYLDQVREGPGWRWASGVAALQAGELKDVYPMLDGLRVSEADVERLKEETLSGMIEGVVRKTLESDGVWYAKSLDMLGCFAAGADLPFPRERLIEGILIAHGEAK